MDEFTKLPTVESCRRIEFTTAEVEVEVVPGIVDDSYVLVVSGTKPYLNMKVDLMPVVYSDRPNYWKIEVIGCLHGIGLPALAPYTVSLPLYGIRGFKGIEVIGATSSQKIDVCGTDDRSGTDDRNLEVNAIANLQEVPNCLYVIGSIMVDRADDQVGLIKAVPQGSNPAILIFDLQVIEGAGPMNGVHSLLPFHYQECGEDVITYTHVTIRYDKKQSRTVEVKFFG